MHQFPKHQYQILNKSIPIKLHIRIEQATQIIAAIRSISAIINKCNKIRLLAINIAKPVWEHVSTNKIRVQFAYSE